MELKALVSSLKTILKDQLGTYSNGQPAIWVEPPKISENLTCKGLEVVIQRYQNPLRTLNLINNQGFENFDWIITLTLYNNDPKSIVILDTAVDLIRRNYPRNRRRINPYHEDMYPQITILLNFSQVFNTCY